MKPYKLFQIDEGTVIDHIDAGNALRTIKILGLNDYPRIVSMAMNLDSSKMGKKDIVKIEHRKLTRSELNKIAIIAPLSTINIIENNKIVDKFKVDIPDMLENIIKCSNPNCITRMEETPSKFIKVSARPVRMRCYYCEKVFSEFKLKR